MLPDNQRDWLTCLVLSSCGSLWLCFSGFFNFCCLRPALLHSDFKLYEIPTGAQRRAAEGRRG